MKRNVLIVEDSSEVRSGLQIALESQGYEVRAAADGRDGIRLFREWNPDIALLDIRMPRMSGIDVCTLIRHESDVPVIMFSGIDESDEVRLAIQRGATDYVLKDTGFRELLNRVSKHLRRRAADLLLAPPTRSQAQTTGQVIPFSPEQAQSTLNSAPVTADPAVGTAVRQRPAAKMAGLNVQTIKVDAPTPAAVEADGPLENLAIVAHSEPAALGELSSIAGRTGFELATASTGQEAIELLATRRPRLLMVGNTLTDMNCISVIQAARNHPLGNMIAVVLALGKRSPELARRARYMGVQEAIFRPWDDGRLDLAVRTALAATRIQRTAKRAA